MKGVILRALEVAFFAASWLAWIVLVHAVLCNGRDVGEAALWAASIFIGTYAEALWIVGLRVIVPSLVRWIRYGSADD